MMDSQNKTVWNDWANYVLSVIKKHEDDLEKAQIKSNQFEIELNRLKEGKFSIVDFQKFLSEDYVIFKTTVLTKAKTYGAIWGVIVTILTTILITFIKNFLDKL